MRDYYRIYANGARVHSFGTMDDMTDTKMRFSEKNNNSVLSLLVDRKMFNTETYKKLNIPSDSTISFEIERVRKCKGYRKTKFIFRSPISIYSKYDKNGQFRFLGPLPDKCFKTFKSERDIPLIFRCLQRKESNTLIDVPFYESDTDKLTLTPIDITDFKIITFENYNKWYYMYLIHFVNGELVAEKLTNKLCEELDIVGIDDIESGSHYWEPSSLMEFIERNYLFIGRESLKAAILMWIDELGIPDEEARDRYENEWSSLINKYDKFIMDDFGLTDHVSYFQTTDAIFGDKNNPIKL